MHIPIFIQILNHICNKGKYMNAVEEFEIYEAFKNTKKQNVKRPILVVLI